MKLNVILDEKGKVIATMRKVEKGRKEAIVRIEPVKEGHILIEDVEVPDEYVDLDPDELHKEVKRHIKISGQETTP